MDETSRASFRSLEGAGDGWEMLPQLGILKLCSDEVVALLLSPSTQQSIHTPDSACLIGPLRRRPVRRRAAGGPWAAPCPLAAVAMLRLGVPARWCPMST